MLKLNFNGFLLSNTRKMVIDGVFKDDIGCVIMYFYLFLFVYLFFPKLAGFGLAIRQRPLLSSKACLSCPCNELATFGLRGGLVVILSWGSCTRRGLGRKAIGLIFLDLYSVPFMGKLDQLT